MTTKKSRNHFGNGAVAEALDDTAPAPASIPLDVSTRLAGAALPTDAVTITIDGVPDSARLSAGVNNGDKSWSLSLQDLEGLAYTPPQTRKVHFLTVRAVSREDASEANTIATFEVEVPVSVAAVEDAARHIEAAAAQWKAQEANRLAAALKKWETEAVESRVASERGEAARLATAHEKWEADAAEYRATSEQNEARRLAAARAAWEAETARLLADERARLQAAAQAKLENRLAKARAAWEAEAAANMAKAEAKWMAATEVVVAEIKENRSAKAVRSAPAPSGRRRHEPARPVAETQ